LRMSMSREFRWHPQSLTPWSLTHQEASPIFPQISYTLIYLEHKLHLAWLNLVHLSLFKYLIFVTVWSLTNIHDSPGKGYKVSNY
jgi:hypothetical protein